MLTTRRKRSIAKDTEVNETMLLILPLRKGVKQSKSSGGVQVLKQLDVSISPQQLNVFGQDLCCHRDSASKMRSSVGGKPEQSPKKSLASLARSALERSTIFFEVIRFASSIVLSGGNKTAEEVMMMVTSNNWSSPSEERNCGSDVCHIFLKVSKRIQQHDVVQLSRSHLHRSYSVQSHQ